ncbi:MULTISPECIES: hypothetical protein [Nocardia]|uniref:hypothetical protein n=1 Tax=Nocardia TaxID=1817 RepID=UPI000D694ABF|nr:MULTISPECIES: hypothetical protein [Nocardia]
MNGLIHYRHCKAFAGKFAATGAAIPASLQLILDNIEAVRNWKVQEPRTIEKAMAEGKLDPSTIGALLHDVVAEPAKDPRLVQQQALAVLARQFNKALHGTSGDEAMAALRPAFEQSITALEAARELGIGAETSAEQVIELGNKAVDAYRTIPSHRATLDTINDVIYSLSYGGDFQIFPHYPWMAIGAGSECVMAAFYLDGAERDMFGAARVLINDGKIRRGGRWMRLLSVSPVKLNSVTRAREIIDYWNSEHVAAEQREFVQTHPPYDAAVHR